MSRNHDQAYQSVGEYFCSFSALDRAVGEALKVIYRLDQHEAADAIVAALGDMGKKVNLVWMASQMAKNPDGSETSHDWKNAVGRTMSEAWEYSNDRNRLAHSFLDPNTDGSVTIEGGMRDVGVHGPWTKDQFKAKAQRLSVLTQQVQTLTNDLSTFAITIPDADWISLLPNLARLILNLATIERLVWRRRTEGHAGRDSREAQQGDQRGPRRSQNQGAAS